jgi:Protein of unknown function (DUF2793)
MLYNQPLGQANVNAPFVNGNPQTGTPGSIIPAPAVEYPQREIINALIAAGLVPTNNDLTQLTQAIRLLGRIPYCLDLGSANNIVIDPLPAITAYAIPLIFAIRVAFVNTGATTINVSGLGAVPFRRTTGAALSPNDLPANGIVIVAWDGAQFQLLSVPGSLAFPAPQFLWHYGVDTSGAANTITVSVDALVVAYVTGLPISVKIANSNTAATVININGIGSANVTRGSGTPLFANDVQAGYIALVNYDGTEFQLLNPLAGLGSGGGTSNDITGPDSPYWLTVKSATVSAQPGGPTLGDTYLIPPGATGAWSGLSGRLVQWNGTSWVFRVYPVGSLISAADTQLFYEQSASGIWTIVQIMTLGKLFFYCQF